MWISNSATVALMGAILEALLVELEQLYQVQHGSKWPIVNYCACSVLAF